MADRIEILIDDFVIDATLEEIHVFNSVVTELPLEKGVIASDHIRTLPHEVKIRGIVSDTPFGELAERRSLTTTAPSQDAIDWLEAIYGERRLVTVATAVRIYENMAMPSLEIVTNPENGEALRFTASFKEFIFVENTSVVTLVAQPRNKKKIRQGARASTEVTDYTTVTDSTLRGSALTGKWDRFNQILVSPLSNETIGF